MTLVTRCPQCATAFRVQPAQLAARAGKVRCGKCGAVFDGVAALVAEAPAAAQPQPEPAPQLALFEAPHEPPAPASVPPPQEPPPAARFLASAPRGLPSGARPAREPPPAARFLASAPPRAPRRAAWAAAAAAALLVLAAQAAIHFRTEIALLFPQSRPALAAACERLGCELRLPRRPELMAIESSDLQPEGRRENVVVLTVAIRNRAPFAQEYPALELALTDERDEPLVRRVLLPADYLGAGAAERAAQGIAAGAEETLRVAFDASRVRAVGYRLYLFYP